MNEFETVLVTGASGFTGEYVSSALKRSGYDVVGTTHSGKVSGGYFDRVYRLDLRDEIATKSLLKEVKPDYIIHLAGISFVGHEDLEAFYSINVVGAEHLLTAAVECGADIKNILISSSANVYGVPSDGEAIREDSRLNPVNHYAISKVALEFVARKFMDRLSVTIARPFNYIGYGQSSSFVVPKIVSAYARGETQLELGSIDVFRDFTAVEDTVNAYVGLLSEPSCYGEVFNVCNGRAVSLAEIIAYMNEIAGIEMSVISNQRYIRKHEIKTLFGSNAKITKYTGWKPELSIKQSLEQMHKRYLLEI